MKQTKQRTPRTKVLSFLLALVLILSMPGLSTTAFASDYSATSTENTSDTSMENVENSPQVILPSPDASVISLIQQSYYESYLLEDDTLSADDVNVIVYWWESETYILHATEDVSPCEMSFEIVDNTEFLYNIGSGLLVYQNNTFTPLAQAYAQQLISSTQLSALYTNYRSYYSSLYAEYSPEQQFFEHSVTGQFELNKVIAYLRPFAKEKVFSPSDFIEIGCTDVWTSVMKKYLVLTFDGEDKQDVLDVVALLEDRCEFELVRPRYYFYYDDSEFEVGTNELEIVQNAINLQMPSNYANDSVFSTDYAPDSIFLQMWPIQSTNLLTAWDVTTGSNTVYVAVLDSGIDATHPDLIGRVDQNLSRSFSDSYNSALEDADGHGTHIAGIIGAMWDNNGADLVGICENVRLVSFRLELTEQQFFVEQVVEAIEYAELNKIQVLNCSFGLHLSAFLNHYIGLNISPEVSGAIYDQMCNEYEEAMSEYSGLVVCAAGNGTLLSNYLGVNLDTDHVIPACCDVPNVISVGSYGITGVISPFSNYGHQSVDIFAPGEEIVSSYPTALCEEVCSIAENPAEKNHYGPVSLHGYHYGSGTSMAAPYVAGVAALILSINPRLNGEELKTIIMESATPDANFTGMCVTGGKLNAYGAVTLTMYTQIDDDYHYRYDPDTDSYVLQEHSFDRYSNGNSNGHSAYCVCGAFSHTANHSYSTAHCTSVSDTHHSSICVDCGYVGVTTHNFQYSQENESYHFFYCSCGYSGLGSHVFDRNYVRIDYETHTVECICGESIEEDHLFFSDPSENPCPCGQYD